MLHILIPVYNEHDNITRTLDEIEQVITTLVAQQEAATRAQAGAAPTAAALTVGTRVFVLSRSRKE